MKLKNTTDFPDLFLSRMVAWVRRQHELPANRIRLIEFLNTRHAFRGTAFKDQGRVIVRIGGDGHAGSRHTITRDGIEIPFSWYMELPKSIRTTAWLGVAVMHGGHEYKVVIHNTFTPYYPMERKYPGRVNAPTFTINDRIEALVKVTAHEIAHFVRWEHTDRNREARIDGMAIPVLLKFRANRDKLMAAWSKPADAVERPKLSRAAQNESKARAMLEKWDREVAKRKRALAMAHKKMREYQRKVRRYEKIAATKSEGGT